jgi:hypothetical protein
MRPVAAFVLVVALTPPLPPEVHSESLTSVGTQQAAAPSSGDYYYLRGERVSLTRSPRELVVRLRSEDEPGPQRLLGLLGRGVIAGPRILADGRAFDLIILPAGADVSAALRQLRTDNQIEFAASVYYHAETRARLAPTDQIIVKMKPGTRSGEVDDLLATHGLAIAHGMIGTADEYILRMLRPGPDDPLRVSRALYETGRFEWVEPDFLQEIEHQQRQ